MSTTYLVEYVELADQSGAISETTVFTPAEAGIYRLSVYLEYSEPGNPYGPNFYWTDSSGNVNTNPQTIGNTGQAFASFIIHSVAGEPISFSTSPLNEAGASYNVHIIIEKLA